MEPIGILINPLAGRVLRSAQLQRSMQGLFSQKGFRTVTALVSHRTNPSDCVQRMIREGCKTIVVSGGDGTIHQVLPALLQGKACLGVLPLGSVNLLAKELGLPPDWKAAADVILAGKRRAIDMGMVNGRPFVQVVGAGLDAQILSYFSSRWRKRLRALYLPLAALAASAKTPLQEWKIFIDGHKMRCQTAAVIVANGAAYGGPFRLAPDVGNQDGLLDVFVLPKIPFVQLTRFLAGSATGAQIYSTMQRWRGSQILVSSEKPVPAHADGEVAFQTPLEIGLQRHALEVFIP